MKVISSTAVLATLVQGSATKREQEGLEVRAWGNTIMCYYTNWAQYRPGRCQFFPEDIDASLCTHLVFAFAKMGNSNQGWTLEPYEWNDQDTEWSEGMYTRMNKLKRQNPNLKTLLAVGGWNHGSSGFTEMVQTDASIEEFITNSMKYTRDHGFDGFDLDWEYPAKCSTDCSPSEDAARFRRLVELYRARINQMNIQNSFMLTAAVGIGADKVLDFNGSGIPSYEPKHLTDHLDLVNMMVYDMHGHWETETGHQALAHAIPYDSRLDGTTNVDWVLRTWIELGADPSKLALGLGAYGRSFALEDGNDNGYLAPTLMRNPETGLYSGESGPCTREPGYLSYYEVCEKIRQHNWQRVWLPEGKAPYAYGRTTDQKGFDWVGYDDTSSIHYKVDMAKYFGLGGIMWWAIDIDDFKGDFCGEGPYPLVNASRNNWLSPNPPSYGTTTIPQTTTTPRTTTTQTTTTQSTTVDSNQTTRPTPPSSDTTTSRTTTTTKATIHPPSGCENGRFYPDPYDCGTYYHCASNDLVTEHCPPGTVWDPELYACQWEHRVDCCNGQRPCPN